MPKYWTADQACNWIRTENPDQAAADQKAKEAAQNALRDACREGFPVVHGRLYGQGDPAKIPAKDWAELAIRSHPKLGVIASPDHLCTRRDNEMEEVRLARFLGKYASWWSDLSNESREVVAKWPPATPTTRWGRVDPLTLRQAAMLWAGLDPVKDDWRLTTDEKDALTPTLQMLTGAVITGDLPADTRSNYLASIGNHGNSLVRRADLVVFAVDRAQRPDFLFCEGKSSFNESAPGSPRKTDDQMRDWMIRHQRDLKDAGKRHGREFILTAARKQFGVRHKVVLDIWNAQTNRKAGRPPRREKKSP